jgi:hypothetical protein
VSRSDHFGPDGRVAQPVGGHSSHDGHRHAPVLSHDQLGRRGDLVGHTDLGGHELSAPRVERSLQVHHGGHPGAPDGDVRHAAAPGSPERVAHDHADVHTEQCLQAGPDAPSRSVGVLG